MIIYNTKKKKMKKFNDIKMILKTKKFYKIVIVKFSFIWYVDSIFLIKDSNIYFFFLKIQQQKSIIQQS